MSSPNRRLRIMAGPNGSGKSTILKKVRENFYSGPFVNADEIEELLHKEKSINISEKYQLAVSDTAFSEYIATEGKSWLEKASKENTPITLGQSKGILTVKDNPSSYDAAAAADFIRYQLLLVGETFTFETVMSSSHKVNFLRQSILAGYKNYLYFICTVDPSINVERVRQRVQLGGHQVPEDKIVKRYNDSLETLEQIIPYCHRVFLFDNSSEERSIEPVAEIDDARRLIMKSENIPWWIEEYIVKKMYQ